MGSSPKSTANQDHHYSTVWRWHFYAALFTLPFLSILALTGAIYLFKPQWEAWQYKNQIEVQLVKNELTSSVLLGRVQSHFPQARVTGFRPAERDTRSVEFTISPSEKEKITAFVNPANGELLGTRDEKGNFQQIVRNIHGKLLLGDVGDRLIELAVCWTIVLLITGFYLAWPREASSWVGALFRLRLRNTKGRVFWRNLHITAGVYGSAVILFLILTGLPWTGFWGAQFADVWNRYPEHLFSNLPKSGLATKVLNEDGDHAVPWAVETLPLPKSTSSGTSRVVNLEYLQAMAAREGVKPGYSILFPQEADGVYTISGTPNDPRGARTIHVDRYSGKILANIGWQDYGLAAKAVEGGIALHMGKFFGFPNQLVMLFGCLATLAITFSAPMMWWRRRPTGKLGLPKRPSRSLGTWRAAVAIGLVLAVCFPLVGASIVFVYVIDRLYLAARSSLGG